MNEKKEELNGNAANENNHIFNQNKNPNDTGKSTEDITGNQLRRAYPKTGSGSTLFSEINQLGEQETPVRNTGRSGESLLQNIESNHGADRFSRREFGNGSFRDVSTGIPQLDGILQQYKNSKPDNEAISKVVSLATEIRDHAVFLKDELQPTDELKAFLRQFQSGGVTKEGRGILDEYYTNSAVVEVVSKLIMPYFKGQKELRILEPSVGTGNFLSAAVGSGIQAKITAFEINPTTAGIAKILYPDTEINLRSFETEFIEENGVKKSISEQYDLVLGNPPYGEHRGFYKGLGELSKVAKYEDYFVHRSLDVLKNGGVLAMVLPSGWLNRQSALKNAELQNAYRLPAGSFKGTQIGTDIIILKKDKSLKESKDISHYFAENPEKVLGENRERSNRFGRMEPYVHGTLSEALEKLEKDFSQKQEIRNKPISSNLSDERQEIKSQQGFTKKTDSQISSLSKGKEGTAIQLSIFDMLESSETEIKQEAEKIVQDLKQGAQNNASEQKEKTDLPQVPKELFEAAEKKTVYLKQTKPEIKKRVLKYEFHKNDAVSAASRHNSSAISKDKLELFKDTHYDGTLNRYLSEKELEIASYHGGKWYHDFYYAEGDIYGKLEQLETDRRNGGVLGAQYEKQKKLLESVLPKAKSLDEIILSPNHEFVKDYYTGKILEKDVYNYDTKQTDTVQYSETLADRFLAFTEGLPSEAFAGSSRWEVRDFVHNETVTGSDKDRNALIRERRKAAANDLFGKFLKEELTEKERKSVATSFNRKYNNTHIPDYSRFPLFSSLHQNFKGKPLILTDVQKAGIGRLTTKGVGLLAHEVGFGKTLSGILALHEAMTRSRASRPLVVVPNDTILKQWFETIFETIPHAKVNVLGNLGVNYDLSGFKAKDGEITLVTYEGFNNIGFKKEITENLASGFNYISEQETKSVTNVSERDFQKEAEKAKETEGRMQRGKKYDWEDFGFDHLTFDEVHNANHIVGKVRIEDRRFASDFRSQNQQTSQLGINTWMAAQYIQEQNDGRNVTLLSATPFTNKPLEYYSILSLIANQALERQGFYNVNTFFETFMEADNDMEIDAKGDVKYKTNVRRFKNNDLFQKLLAEYIDIKGEEDNPELKRPNRINKEYKIEQNELTQEQYENLSNEFDNEKDGAILTFILNARLTAISPYLSPYSEINAREISSKSFVENSPKLKMTMDMIRQNKADCPKAGQIIYSELAVEHFPKLKEHLVNEVGFRENEVAIISGSTSKTQRNAIQEAYNKGDIKIVIGSESIQEGMNLQEKTSDMYLLTLPYNFTSLRQTEGRGWRQGNQWENIRINYMLMSDSIDVFMLQKLQAKQARYLEAMKKGASVVDVSDIDTHELKTSIITDPDRRAEIDIQVLKKRIENEKQRYEADHAFVMRKFEDFRKIKESYEYQKASLDSKLKEISQGDDYWKPYIKTYEDNLLKAEKEMKTAMEELAKKGVDVNQIQQQSEAFTKKMEEFEKKLEALPEKQKELAQTYRLEKQEKANKDSSVDFVKERAAENKYFYRISDDQSPNISLLKKQLLYMGFGEDPALHRQLENEVRGGKDVFSIKIEKEKLSAYDNTASFSLEFSFNEAVGRIIFNQFKAKLVDDNGKDLSHTFNTAREITAKEAVNLLEGRFVKSDEGFLKLRLNEPKNESGNYPVEIYPAVDTVKIVEQAELVFSEKEEKRKVVESLERGDAVDVKFYFEGKQIPGKAVLNPVYKSLNLYDAAMNRMNDNKSVINNSQHFSENDVRNMKIKH